MRTIVGQTVNDTLSGVFKIYNSNKKLIEKISLSHGFLHGERIQYSLRNTKTVFSYRFGCLDTLTKYIGNKPILKYINRNCKEFKFITFKNGLPIDTAITDSNKKESQKVGYISNIKQLL